MRPRIASAQGNIYLVYSLERLNSYVSMSVGVSLLEATWSDLEAAQLTGYAFNLCEVALYPVLDLLCDAERLAHLQRVVFQRIDLDTLLDVPLDSDLGLFARYTEHYLEGRLATLAQDAGIRTASGGPRESVTFAWFHDEGMAVKVTTKVPQGSLRHAFEHTLSLKYEYATLREFLFSLRDFANEIWRDVAKTLETAQDNPRARVGSPESQAYIAAFEILKDLDQQDRSTLLDVLNTHPEQVRLVPAA